jgi:hypothetical protein
MLVMGGWPLNSFAMRFIMYNAAALAVGGSALGAWLRWGRRVRRWPVGWRWLLAAAAWGMNLGNVVLFGLIAH